MPPQCGGLCCLPRSPPDFLQPTGCSSPQASSQAPGLPPPQGVLPQPQGRSSLRASVSVRKIDDPRSGRGNQGHHSALDPRVEARFRGDTVSRSPTPLSSGFQRLQVVSAREGCCCRHRLACCSTRPWRLVPQRLPHSFVCRLSDSHLPGISTDSPVGVGLDAHFGRGHLLRWASRVQQRQATPFWQLSPSGQPFRVLGVDEFLSVKLL